jgi:hypothetical protein
MRRAREQSKHQMCREMLQRALWAGYLLVDAWFGCKENIACCLENQLVALFQMERGSLTYQY